MENENEKKGPEGKIRIGRLYIDPVFLILFSFFSLSALFMLIYILLSL
ncbi:MAG: hypothetical protein ACOY31_12515 [Bacillota bacterium]